MQANVSAASRTIEFPATAGWKHAGSGVILTREIAGLVRESLADSSTTELDISAQFRSPDRATLATIYIFRPANNSVPIWFDRSRTMIELGDVFGLKGNPIEAQPTAFAPIPTGTTSGLKIVYPVPASNFRSTALALAPVGEWVLAIRITSSSLDVPALDGELVGIIRGIRWPPGLAPAPIATPVETCETPLPPSKAKMIRNNGANVLMDSVMGIVAAKTIADDPKIRSAPPLPFCREPGGVIDYGVYRAVGSTDAYQIALGDAGVSVLVGPTININSGTPRYSVTLQRLDSDLTYPSFNRLPSPEQVTKLINQTGPLSETSRNGNNTNIILSSPK